MIAGVHRSPPAPAPTWAALAAALLAVLWLALRAMVGLALVPPQRLAPPAASLEPALARWADEVLAGARVEDAEVAIAFALAQTSEALRFGLGHPTRLSFGAGTREGNYVEYAHMSAAVFNRAAGARRLKATTFVVRSDARVFGWRIPSPAFRDHDWALVVAEEGAAPRRFYVDAAFADAWLGWKVTRNVVERPKGL